MQSLIVTLKWRWLGFRSWLRRQGHRVGPYHYEFGLGNNLDAVGEAGTACFVEGSEKRSQSGWPSQGLGDVSRILQMKAHLVRVFNGRRGKRFDKAVAVYDCWLVIRARSGGGGTRSLTAI